MCVTDHDKDIANVGTYYGCGNTDQTAVRITDISCLSDAGGIAGMDADGVAKVNAVRFKEVEIIPEVEVDVEVDVEVEVEVQVEPAVEGINERSGKVRRSRVGK